MRTLVSKRYALGICIIAAILAGCGGSQSPIGAPGATPKATPVRVLAAPPPPARNAFLVIHKFTGSPDGAEPQTGIVFNRDNPNVPSDLGVTAMGGDSNNDGTLYGLTKGKGGSWTESVLYSFKGGSNGDGSEPTGLVLIAHTATDSTLVSTAAGGTSNNGAAIALTPTSSGVWKETFVYSFGGTPDGANPSGNPLVDTQGNIYGTTSAGGTNGLGTVYRLQPKGSSYSESILYSFGSGKSDGAHPMAGLILDKKGALYGTTVKGGSAGYGSVFKLTPSGSGYTESILYSFQGAPKDGAYPYGGLTPVGGGLSLIAGGKVIGMTSSAGSHGGGIAYEVGPTSSGGYKESVLWNFGSVSGDGTDPHGGVCVNKKTGVIAGTTVAGGSGGSSGFGTFFTLTPSGTTYKESVYSFTGTDGANPYGGPSVDGNGDIYLTTAEGGKKNKGAVVHVTHGIGRGLCKPTGG